MQDISTPKGLRLESQGMPQSLSAVHVHLVFSTKDRRAYLRDPTLRRQLHAYLGGTSNQLDCPVLRVGGVEDHVHILARLGRSITLADWVKELKRVSNGWLKERDPELVTFQWQAGYSVFSVSQSNVSAVSEYIENQEVHHQKSSFKDELRSLLARHQIPFDERYIWD